MILFLLAGILAVVSVVLAYRSASLLLGGSKADGEVVRMERIAGSASSDDLDAPIIRYPAHDGRMLEGRGPAEQFSPFGIGDRVTVYFDRRTPTRIQIATFNGLWMASLAVLVMVLLLVGTGLVMRASERGASAANMVGGVLLMIGVPLLLAGLGETAGRAHLLRHGFRGRGTVLNGEGKAWKLFKSSGESFEIPAKIRFTTADARTIEFITPGLNAAYARPGEGVQIVYPARQPHGAAVLGFRYYWLGAAILGGVGALVVGIGILLVRRG